MFQILDGSKSEDELLKNLSLNSAMMNLPPPDFVAVFNNLYNAATGELFVPVSSPLGPSPSAPTAAASPWEKQRAHPCQFLAKTSPDSSMPAFLPPSAESSSCVENPGLVRKRTRTRCEPPPRPPPDENVYPHLNDLPRTLDRNFRVPVGIHPGSWFGARVDVMRAGLHTGTQAGICYSAEGARTVVISGGYELNDDHGEYFYLCGQGGRAKSKDQGSRVGRVGDLDKDQKYTKGNAALLLNLNNRTPVHVIRGSSSSVGRRDSFSPSKGYRYDGLYQVIDREEIFNVDGFMAIRFLFVRYKGQKPLEQCVREGEEAIRRYDQEQASRPLEPIGNYRPPMMPLDAVRDD